MFSLRIFIYLFGLKLLLCQFLIYYFNYKRRTRLSFLIVFIIQAYSEFSQCNAMPIFFSMHSLFIHYYYYSLFSVKELLTERLVVK